MASEFDPEKVTVYPIEFEDEEMDVVESVQDMVHKRDFDSLLLLQRADRERIAELERIIKASSEGEQ